MISKKIFTMLLVASSLYSVAQEKRQVKKLPAEATAFLEANFKGIQIQEVKKEKDRTTFKYEVTLINGAEVEFNNRGRWKEMESETASLPVSMFQPSVGSYIQKTYPGAKITEVKKGNRFNFVEINNETMLQFDTEGNFYRIMPN